MIKASHEEVDYRQGRAYRHCGLCVMFRAPHTCMAVESPVSEDGLCDDFKRGDVVK